MEISFFSILIFSPFLFVLLCVFGSDLELIFFHPPRKQHKHTQNEGSWSGSSRSSKKLWPEKSFTVEAIANSCWLNLFLAGLKFTRNFKRRQKEPRLYASSLEKSHDIFTFQQFKSTFSESFSSAASANPQPPEKYFKSALFLASCFLERTP